MTPHSLLLSFIFCLTLSAQEKSASTTPTQPAPEVPTRAISTEQTFSNFGQMIKIGTPNKKVNVPSFEAGKMTSMITADVMTRVSETELIAEKMVIQNFAENEKENLTVKMRSATYDMGKKTLSSTERSRVERADFSIEGDSMVYDTTNSTGQMVGRVIMIIKDASAISAPGQKPKKPATSTPANTKQP